jgi:hypothetical protein
MNSSDESYKKRVGMRPMDGAIKKASSSKPASIRAEHRLSRIHREAVVYFLYSLPISLKLQYLESPSTM